MVLESHRRSLDLFFDPVTKALSFIHPNVFSALSFVFAVSAGIMYGLSDDWTSEIGGGMYSWFLLMAFLFIILNSIADTLDGRVARHTGKTSKVGDFLDHTFDRFSDIAMLIGIAFSPYCNTTFGLIAAIFVLLASYMGTQAQAVGCGRNYTGIMGRADRMVTLMFITLLQFVVLAGWGVKGITEPIFGLELVPLELAMGLMLIGGIITVLMRGADTYRGLSDQEKEEEYRERRRGTRPRRFERG
ncbi:MAG: CDP-alcohol phosphatidyltransferase family protein [Candidatus Thermoplasmatota archaeon]|nr:CDP-alcohol phosphatidyltransferase family protein [Candidatus Thermoplasmatota archaeon]